MTALNPGVFQERDMSTCQRRGIGHHEMVSPYQPAVTLEYAQPGGEHNSVGIVDEQKLGELR